MKKNLKFYRVWFLFFSAFIFIYWRSSFSKQVATKPSNFGTSGDNRYKSGKNVFKIFCFYEMCAFIWLNEVRVKISILLKTTGGISFSLEGFEKSLFSIWNLTHGDLQSTGGIQISIQRVYNFTGGIQISFLGVYNSTGGIQISFQGIYNSTGGTRISFQWVYNSTEWI